MKFGTTNPNPFRRNGRTGYSKCPHCGLRYTDLGIAKHRNYCDGTPKVKTPKKGKRK